MTDFTLCTAVELFDLYQTRSVSPVTVAQQVLEKIQSENHHINAFCFSDPDTTLSQAHASEQRWKSGQPLSALDGVPISIKDMIHTKSWPTLCGSLTIDPNQYWNKDAPVVEKLKSVGAVLLGKTATAEFGLSNQTDTKLNGTTKNPCNLHYSAGGSSGGSAAAVAAGLGPISVATDGGGSIRQPAAFCGVVGFKPTPALIPDDFDHRLQVASVGPIAKTVQDVMLFMTAVVDMPVIDRPLHSLRIGYSPDLGYIKNANQQVLDAVESVLQGLRDTGAEVSECDGRMFPGIKARQIMSEIYYQNIHKLFQGLPSSLHDQVNLEYYKIYKTTQVKDVFAQKKVVHKYMQQVMQQYDILVTPATTDTAFAIGSSLDVMNDSTQFLTLFNLCGQPAVVLPCGFSSNGLPISVQIVGAPGADALVLAVAQTLEKLIR